MERIRIVSELLGETFGRFDTETRSWKSEALKEAYELEAWELMEKLSLRGYYIVKAPASVVKKINETTQQEEVERVENMLMERIKNQ